MSTIEEAAATLRTKYDNAPTDYIPLRIAGIVPGLESEVPAIIVRINHTRVPSMNQAQAEALVPECALGVGWDGHRVVVTHKTSTIADSGPIE
jgi:hypothetical protein